MTSHETIDECSPRRRDLSRNDSVSTAWTDRLRLTRSTTAIVMVLSLLFLHLCNQPIWHTDVWGHLSYGKVIWDTKSIPKTEPLLPLSREIRFVDSPWLSQLIGFGVISMPRLQMAGLQGLYALSVTCCGGILCYWLFRQTQSAVFALVGLGIFIVPPWICILILRPQLAGLICYVLVLVRLSPMRPQRWDWILIPGIFLLWANLHPSFPIGLGLLGCLCAGRIVDRFEKTGSFALLGRDRRLRGLFGLTLVSAVATLANPYGLELHREVLRFSANPNLGDLTEWQALSIRDAAGQAFIASVVILTWLGLKTPRRVRAWEFLLPVGLAVASLWSVRMLVWWIPVCSLLIPRHASALWNSWAYRPVLPDTPRSFRWTIVSIATASTCLVVSPMGQAVIADRHRDPSVTVSSYTPLFAARYLSENPPTGMVFATYEWSDYLQWAGPPGMKLLVNSHAHLVPPDVWRTYMQVIELRSGWRESLDRYEVDLIVVDRAFRSGLIMNLEADPNWERLVEQEGQCLFRRVRPNSSETTKRDSLSE